MQRKGIKILKSRKAIAVFSIALVLTATLSLILKECNHTTDVVGAEVVESTEEQIAVEETEETETETEKTVAEKTTTKKAKEVAEKSSVFF